MEEAEIALEEQRKVVTRYMMHGKFSASDAGAAKAAALGTAPKAMSRARILGKLSGGGNSDGEDDDVMGDVRFSSSGGGRNSKARRELVSFMGDEGTKVDDDCVLGGANDSEFGGRRRFAKVSLNNEEADDGGAAAERGGGKDSGTMTATGFDAGAMEEGFYQRDVAKEYEALDYDANEQFDDDDVNVGEDEIMDDGGGYGGGDYVSGDDNMIDSEEDEASDEDHFGGMATSSGFRAMLAKASGEAPANSSANAVPSPDASDASGKISPTASGAGGSSDAGDKVIENMIGAAKNQAESKRSSEQVSREEENKAAGGIEKDKDGKRLITLEAVRREIWLNNGAITSKRLMKKFDVTKKNPDRQVLFKQIVLELCTMKKGADGNKLVLKQHYSKI